MAGPVPRCVLDRRRPCNACVADSPATCPYPYLLGEPAEPAGRSAAVAA